MGKGENIRDAEQLPYITNSYGKADGSYKRARDGKPDY
jgi:hypothetical protein